MLYDIREDHRLPVSENRQKRLLAEKRGIVEQPESMIKFWKMHGAGNDFILVDDRDETFPADQREWLAKTATRRTGVGCEGIILIQPSKKADFRMRFFNPDGREAEMCGNGARCAARLTHDIGAAPASMSIETIAGTLKAESLGENVRIHMMEPKDWRLDKTLKLDGTQISYCFVNTGVPHVVVETDELNTCDVHSLGRSIRYHEAFAPRGTNANFIQVTGRQAIRVRTYERGVEGETLACGTGIVSSALIGARHNRVIPPVQVTAASGDILTVDFSMTENGASNVTLLGSAVYIFQGNLPLP